MPQESQPQESQQARELRILKAIVLAVPRAVRWTTQQFVLGLRSGLASTRDRDRPPRS